LSLSHLDLAFVLLLVIATYSLFFECPFGQVTDGLWSFLVCFFLFDHVRPFHVCSSCFSFPPIHGIPLERVSEQKTCCIYCPYVQLTNIINETSSFLCNLIYKLPFVTGLHIAMNSLR
jgi:hypothetical protein